MRRQRACGNRLGRHRVAGWRSPDNCCCRQVYLTTMVSVCRVQFSRGIATIHLAYRDLPASNHGLFLILSFSRPFHSISMPWCVLQTLSLSLSLLFSVSLLCLSLALSLSLYWYERRLEPSGDTLPGTRPDIARYEGRHGKPTETTFLCVNILDSLNVSVRVHGARDS